MAEAAILLDEEPPVAAEGLMLQDILAPGVNLAERLDEHELTKIGQRVIRDVKIDETSREDWAKRYDRWMDMAMQVRVAKNHPWPKAANYKWPLLTTASVQFQARAYPAIVDGSNLVKGRVLGPDPQGEKRQRADRIGQHMTWQLLYRMPGWEEETDRLLLMLPICGCVFRKSYFDSIANTNCSEMVSGKDFIINYWAKSLDSAPRYTHVLRYYPHEVKEKVAAGLWLEVRVEGAPEDAEDEDALVEFYEQHRMIDLDDDGYPEPYVVTTTKEGEVARIVPCFGPDEIIVMNLATDQPIKLAEIIESGDEEGWKIAGDIIKIERRQYFTKYAFIPAPDGSFYDIGFGFLTEDLADGIDGALNRMMDAGALQNAGGGFIGSGINAKGGDYKFRLGEWKRIDVMAGTLRDNIFRMEHPGPSAVLFNLLGMLIEAAKEITSVQDVMTGEGTTNQPATTTLALIEQGHKVMTAIFKRVHRAFGNELRILRRLNRDYLDEEEYFQLNDSAEPEEKDPATGQPVPQEPMRVGREDYQDADLDVVPVSDPSMASDMHKLMRSEAEFASFKDDPLVNQMELRRRRMQALGTTDIDKMLDVPPPPPDPKVLIEGAKLALQKEKDGAIVRMSDATAAQKLAAAAQVFADLGLIEDAAELAAAAAELGGAVDGDDQGAGGVRPMEEQPPDAGLSPVRGGPPLEPDGGMGDGQGGAGLVEDPSPGGGLGAVGGDQV